MRNTQDKLKEKEQFSKMEHEQSNQVFDNKTNDIKNNCIRILGKDTFEKAYSFYKNARDTKMPLRKIDDEFKKIAGSERNKMDAMFDIVQMVEMDCSK